MNTTLPDIQRPVSLKPNPGLSAHPHLLELEHMQAGDPNLSGGKGASLSSLSRKGFPVPNGFVVTSNAYADFLRAAHIPNDFNKEIKVRPELLQQFRQALRETSLPGYLAREVAVLFRNYPGDQNFAVRSSSTLEDLAEAAFAGMHSSFLNCCGQEAVLTAIHDCYISLWSDEAVAYREHHGFCHSQAKMAVIVQTMINCEVAGVGFSMHPVTGDPHTSVINANLGLGESVVNGQHEIDHFEIDRASGKVKKSNIGNKTVQITSNPHSDGTIEIQIDNKEAEKPCLDSDQLLRINAILEEIDSSCGFPQDIEWGISENQVFILQSRPVTRIPPRWTRDESAERFPNAITPLTWDMVDQGFHKSLSYSLNLMGLPPYQGKWFSSFDHYIYGNQNAVSLYLERNPISIRDFDDLRVAIPEIRNTCQWVQDLPSQWAGDLDAFLQKIGRFNASRLEEIDDVKKLWARVEEIVQTGSDYFQPNIAISITQAKLYRILIHLIRMVVGESEAPRMFDSVLGFCETRTCEINRELFELAKMIEADVKLDRLIHEHESREIIQSGVLETFPEFAQHFERFIENHGHRELEFDAYYPTWVEVPWIVLDNLRLVLRSIDEAPSPVRKENKLRIQMYAAEGRLLSKIPDDLHFFFHELIRMARTYTSLDDREHYHTTRLTPPLRSRLRALGNALVSRGYIDEPLDVFFSEYADLDKAVQSDNHDSWMEWSERVRINRARYLEARSREPENEIGQASESLDFPENGSLQGIPGSPGCVEGVVYKVRSPEDFAGMPENAILVARATSPSWTPLFYSAAGVITESGGPLSHGAVIARELHIPALMSVRRALSILENGQRVKVDGTGGIVSIID